MKRWRPRPAAEYTIRVRQLPRRRLAPDQVFPLRRGLREPGEDPPPEERRLRRLPRARRETLRRRGRPRRGVAKEVPHGRPHQQKAVEERAAQQGRSPRQQPRFQLRQVSAVTRTSRRTSGMKRIPLCVAIVAVAAAVGSRAAGRRKRGDPRRTPAVEIFQRYKDAVVDPMGPMANP